MLRNLAVALLAATMFTAPALAQGASKTDTPPAAAATTAPTTATKAAPNTATKTDSKTVTAKPAQKSATVHKGRRHFAHIKHVKHAKYVKAAPSTDSAKQHVRHVAKKPASTTGSEATSAAKPKSGTN